MQSLLDQREEREDATIAIVVRAHDEEDVFDGDDHRQRPHDQRQHAEHIVRRGGGTRPGGNAGGEGVTIIERVERTRPDVPVDDAERRERKQGEPLARRIRLENGPLSSGRKGGGGGHARRACKKRAER